MAEKIHTGEVLWFDDLKGYGFVKDDADEKELFVHFSSILQEGRKSLNQDDKVEFTREKGEKGPCAKNVKLVED